jgi:hypothetical protein
MMIETRIYGSGEYARTVVISHGASESMIISDTDWPEEHDGWGNPIDKKKKFKWFNPDPVERLEEEILGI